MVLKRRVQPYASGVDGVPVSAIRAHLGQILASPSFETSKRNRELLTHLVESTLAGETDHLKERCIAEDVFERVGYDPSENNLVRVAAKDLRKRLAQYYDTHADALVRIELPRGAYVPAFYLHPQPTVAPPATLPPGRGSWHWKRWALAATVLAAAALAAWIWTPRSSPEEAFWKPVLAAGKPAVIWSAGWGAVMHGDTRREILKHDQDTEPYTLRLRPDELTVVDQVIAYGHVYGIATLSSWLAAHGQPPQLRLGFWSTPSGLAGHPLILFGALNNPWTIDLTKDLRFRVERGEPGSIIIDGTDPRRRWSIPGYDKQGYNVRVDYGLITRIIDQASGQVRISIGGIAHYSSQAAAEFLTTPKYWSNMAQVAPRGWEHLNMQVVLEVKVIEKVPQSPKPVAWHFW
jgi:hypothetical protein